MQKWAYHSPASHGIHFEWPRARVLAKLVVVVWPFTILRFKKYMFSVDISFQVLKFKVVLYLVQTRSYWIHLFIFLLVQFCVHKGKSHLDYTIGDKIHMRRIVIHHAKLFLSLISKKLPFSCSVSLIFMCCWRGFLALRRQCLILQFNPIWFNHSLEILNTMQPVTKVYWVDSIFSSIAKQDEFCKTSLSSSGLTEYHLLSNCFTNY